MPFETFLLERNQTLYENEVEINLTESGVKAMTLREFLTPAEQQELLDLPLGYGHTEGTPALRRAIAALYPGAGPENVLVTAGSCEANFVAAWTLLGGGSAAAVLPNYLQVPNLARAFGAEVKPIHLKSAQDWALDLAELDRAMTPDTRAIILCNPNNPTGKVLDEAEMAAVVAAAERVGAWILADEIYRGAELGERPETASFWGRSSRVLCAGSISKALGHSGLRVGWLVGPADTIADIRRRQDYTSIGTTAVGQYVATRVLAPERRQALLRRAREILNRNRDIVAAWVGRHGNRLSWRPPEAGGIAFIRYDLPMGSEDFSRLVRERESCFVVAGAWFGLEGHIRLGIGGDSHELEEGLKRVDRVLATL